MLNMLLASIICLLVSSTLASPLVLHETRDVLPRNVIDRRRIEPEALLPMRIGLTQNKELMKLAEKWLMDVSDPTSAKYGQHWTQNDVIEAFKPSQESVDAVIEWLWINGIQRVTHTENKQWLAFDLPAWQAETLLNTAYYEHLTEKGRFEASCDEYYLPEDLQEHIDFIKPGIVASDVSGRTKRSKKEIRDGLRQTKSYIASRNKKLNRQIHTSLDSNPLANCSGNLTPQCIQALYNFTFADPSLPVSPTNALGLYADDVPWYQGDLDMLYSRYTNIPNGTAPIFDSIDGGEAPPKKRKGFLYRLVGLSETDLDIEASQPIIYPQNVTVYQTNDRYWSEQYRIGNQDVGLFNTWLDGIDGSYCTYCAYGECGNADFDPKYPDVYNGSGPGIYMGKLQCGVYKPANVISISYGLAELDYPFNYQKRQCNEYMKLALQGVSLFFSSGDLGVDFCGEDGRVFGTPEPSGCPWITSVGGTEILPGNSPYQPEVAANNNFAGFSSGGGFSIIFEAPQYQKDAIETYYNATKPTYPYFRHGDYKNGTGRYNRDGRGFPDIAAIGTRLATVIHGKFAGSDGTSVSAPIVAALFNRIVEERIRAGKKPLGFLNPSIYQNPQLFNDIVKGDNFQRYIGCKGGSVGFETATGWDPVTGVGTPNYPKMLEYYMSLP